MENALNKPVQLLIKETRENFVNVINTSRLPMCIVELIVKDIYSDIKSGSNLEYEQVVRTYKEKQKDDE